MKYDAILVFGRGVYKDGSTSESAKSTVEEAVKLYDSGQSDKIIFSGKWTYTLDYIPPNTEARAMADHAITLGLPKKAILLEEEAYTTVTNVYFIKNKFLIPNNWTRVALVSVYPLGQRALWTLELILGPDYNCELINTSFSFPAEILKKMEEKEKEKREHGQKLCKLHSLRPGDHETIFRVTEEDLNKNWRPR